MPNDPIDSSWHPTPGCIESFIDALGPEPKFAAELVLALEVHLTGPKANYASKERRLRFVVEEALRAGFPVIADRNGYRLAQDSQQLADYADKLQRSADGLTRKAELVLNVRRRWFNAA